VPIRALVVGSLVQDLSFRIPKRPEPGEVVIAEEYGSFRGGKGYNQAVALARLGAEVTIVGAVGRDEYGEGFIAALRREGVDAERVVRLPDASTGLAVPMITPDGDVAFVQHPGANRGLSAAHCEDLPECDVLLLQGEVKAAASEAAARVVRGRGALVVLNPAPALGVTPRMVAECSVLVPNEAEARELTGDAEGSGEHLAAALCADGRAAVVTLGARGAAWAAETSAGTVKPPQVTAVDATAAGDSFCAALAIALAEGADWPDAVRFATAAGAHAVTIRGAHPSLPTRPQAEALLATM